MNRERYLEHLMEIVLRSGYDEKTTPVVLWLLQQAGMDSTRFIALGDRGVLNPQVSRVFWPQGAKSALEYRQQILTPGEFLERFTIPTLPITPASVVYNLPVDRRPVPAIIKDGGYPYNTLPDGDYPEEPCVGSTIPVQLVHFNHDVSTTTALMSILAAGHRPATLRELLCFGAQYREAQLVNPIAGLGSARVDFNYHANTRVLMHPLLTSTRGPSRMLAEQYSNIGMWSPSWRFLIVHA